MKRQMYEFSETVTKDLLLANSSIKATSEEVKSLHDDVQKTEKYIQNLSSNFVSESKHLRLDIESVLKLEIEQMNMKLQSSIENAKGIDGGWSAWNHWQSCSVTCGTGLQSRRRSCINPEPQAHGRHCQGDFTDYQLCFKVDCSADPPSCRHLENGKATRYYDEYKVACNEGYKLNLFNKDEPYCKCVDGGLLCKYGNQTPICEPEPCEIPHNYEDLMTIFIRKGRSIINLSAGVNVAVGDKVFFNCRDTGDKFLEPVNRKFKCENGKWIEDEKDEEWRLGYNGAFPKCRNASCVPSCQNGGACIRDNKCRCPHLTSGSACEDILCDDHCKRNGGTCVGPGKCGKCPTGQHGENCEKRGCQLPDDEHRIHPNYDWVEFGWYIADQKIECSPGYKPNISGIITCLEGGRWSQTIECWKIQKTRYQITVRTGDAWTAGTTALVYIYLIGEHYSSSKLSMTGFPTRNSELSSTVEAEYITPLRSIKAGRERVTFPDDWQLVSVVVNDLIHRQHYIFKRDNPVWVDEDIDMTLPLFG